MGMFDSIWVSGTCQGCGTYSDAWEIQTKEGDCCLEGWTLGSKTTLKTSELIDDIWCTTCAYAPLTEEDRVQNALQGYPIIEHRIGDEWARRVENHPLTYVRFMLKDGVLLEADFLKTCPSCRGNRSIWPTRAQCSECCGRGYLNQVVEQAGPAKHRERKAVWADVTDADVKRGIRMLKAIGKKKPGTA